MTDRISDELGVGGGESECREAWTDLQNLYRQMEDDFSAGKIRDQTTINTIAQTHRKVSNRAVGDEYRCISEVEREALAGIISKALYHAGEGDAQMAAKLSRTAHNVLMMWTD